MSTLTITPLVPGETASAADHNANVTAWENATAADSINDDNVREEGIDTVNVEDETIEATIASGDDWFFESETASPAYGAAAPVVMGGNTVQIGPLTIAALDDVLIECAAWIQADPVLGGAETIMALRYSNDSGGSWTTVNYTNRPFSTNRAVTVENQNYVVTHRHAYGVSAGTAYYQLYVVQSPNADVVIKNAVLWAQKVKK